MPKYIKPIDGKFAGSVGEGKSTVPTKTPDDLFIPASPANCQMLCSTHNKAKGNR